MGMNGLFGGKPGKAICHVQPDERFGGRARYRRCGLYLAGPSGAFMTGEGRDVDGGTQDLGGDQWTSARKMVGGSSALFAVR